MYKNLESRIKFYWKTIEHTLNVILAHTLIVILRLVSRIHTKHLSNVILGFIPRIHAKHSSSLDTRDRLFVTPEYNGKQSLIKGLDVVCQCTALFSLVYKVVHE